MYKTEHQIYIDKLKRNKRIIKTAQLLIIFLILGLWELLARLELINTFLSSSPSNIIKTTIDLFINNNLLLHIFTTLYETIISFTLATLLGLFLATILWTNKTIAKILDPYLTILNSLPKVSLGPLIIILFGANIKSIVLMAILITIFTTAINMYHAFITTDESKIILLQSFKATKKQIFIKLIFRGNIPALINTLKINISLSLIGVIMGELLVSKQGLGYLITYGSQVFNLNLVITSIFILGIISYLLYLSIEKIEKRISNKN